MGRKLDKNIPNSYRRLIIGDDSLCKYEVYSQELKAMVNCQEKAFENGLCKEHYGFAKINGMIKGRK